MAILSSPLQYVTSTPPVTRALTAATVGFSCLYFWLHWRAEGPFSAPYLTLIPGSSFFFPWTFLISGFVETTILELICTLLFVPASFRYLERLWGPVETLKFIAVTIVVSNILSFGLNWLEFLLFRNADLFLYGMDYHGQMSLIAGILVAFTQIIPEHQVHLFGLFLTRVKTLPMAYLGLCNVMVLIGFQAPWINIQWGFFVGWVYLRFYKKNKGDVIVGESYGDRSETFAFVLWFPPFLHTPVGFISNTVYNLANRFKLIPTSNPDIEAGGYAQVPGGPRAEAERRRTLALKALDQRMAAAAAPPPTTSANTSSQSLSAAGAPPERPKSSNEQGVGATSGEGKGKGKVADSSS